MNLKRLVVLLAASGLALSAQGADLIGVYRDALSSDPVYQAARAQYQASIERLPQARAGYLPFVSGSAAAYRNYNERDGRPGPRLLHARLQRDAVAAGLPDAELDRDLAGGEAGAAGRGHAHHGQPGPDPARGAGLLRRPAGAGQRRALRRPEARDLRAARAGQAQLRGRHRDDRRHPRGAGALRPGGRQGSPRRQRPRGEEAGAAAADRQVPGRASSPWATSWSCRGRSPTTSTSG